MTSRDETIQIIRQALRRRSGKAWSVTGGRGTAWGWITIDAPPARRTAHWVLKTGAPDLPENYTEVINNAPGHITPADRAELAKLLGIENTHCQGVSIPASSAHYREYIARAKGETPTEIAQPYWD